MVPVDVNPLRDFKLPIIWVLGGPGSGKGTQCERIVAKYGFTHLSTGDLLREEVASGSDRGKDFSAIMQKGDLIANDIILELLTEAISKNVATSKGFLIDGYPREKDQGVAFENAISSPAVILYFDASEETLTNRLQERSRSSGRADDNEETIKLCLQTFLKNNDAVIAQYPDILKRINAENSVDEIFVQVEEELDAII